MLMLVGERPQPQGEHPPEPEGTKRATGASLSAVPDRIDPAIEWPGSRRR